MHGQAKAQLHIFLIQTLEDEWSTSRPSHFNPSKEAPSTHWKEYINTAFIIFWAKLPFLLLSTKFQSTNLSLSVYQITEWN
jgi:hypothetical protein